MSNDKVNRTVVLNGSTLEINGTFKDAALTNGENKAVCFKINVHESVANLPKFYLGMLSDGLDLALRSKLRQACLDRVDGIVDGKEAKVLADNGMFANLDLANISADWTSMTDDTFKKWSFADKSIPSDEIGLVLRNLVEYCKEIAGIKVGEDTVALGLNLRAYRGLETVAKDDPTRFAKISKRATDAAAKAAKAETI